MKTKIALVLCLVFLMFCTTGIAEEKGLTFKAGDMVHITREACESFNLCGFAKVISLGVVMGGYEGLGVVKSKQVLIEKDGERLWINSDWLE